LGLLYYTWGRQRCVESENWANGIKILRNTELGTFSQGQGGTIPRAPNHYGGAESLRGVPNDCGWRRKVVTLPHVHSSIH